MDSSALISMSVKAVTTTAVQKVLRAATLLEVISVVADQVTPGMGFSALILMSVKAITRTTVLKMLYAATLQEVLGVVVDQVSLAMGFSALISMSVMNLAQAAITAALWQCVPISMAPIHVAVQMDIQEMAGCVMISMNAMATHISAV